MITRTSNAKPNEAVIEDSSHRPENSSGTLTGTFLAPLATAVVHELAARLDSSPRKAEFFRAIAHAVELLFRSGSPSVATAAPSRPVSAAAKASPAPSRPMKAPCCSECHKPGHRRQSCPRLQVATRESRPRPASNGSAKHADADPDHGAPAPAGQPGQPREAFVADFVGRLRALRLDQARKKAHRKRPGRRPGRQKPFRATWTKRHEVFEALDRAVDGMLSVTLEVLDDGSPILRELSASAERHGRWQFKNWREPLDFFVAASGSRRWRDVDPLRLRVVSDAMKAAAAEELERRGMAFVDLRLPLETEAMLETEAFFEEQAMRAVG